MEQVVTIAPVWKVGFQQHLRLAAVSVPKGTESTFKGLLYVPPSGHLWEWHVSVGDEVVMTEF